MQNLYRRKRAWLLGDSGYPLEPWLLVPYKNEGNPACVHFNHAHSKARSVVERCIGKLYLNWRSYKVIHIQLQVYFLFYYY